jgi:hypothetical protein
MNNLEDNGWLIFGALILGPLLIGGCITIAYFMGKKISLKNRNSDCATIKDFTRLKRRSISLSVKEIIVLGLINLGTIISGTFLIGVLITISYLFGKIKGNKNIKRSI